MNDCYFDKKDWRLCKDEVGRDPMSIHPLVDSEVVDLYL